MNFTKKHTSARTCVIAGTIAATAAGIVGVPAAANAWGGSEVPIIQTVGGRDVSDGSVVFADRTPEIYVNSIITGTATIVDEQGKTICTATDDDHDHVYTCTATDFPVGVHHLTATVTDGTTTDSSASISAVSQAVPIDDEHAVLVDGVTSVTGSTYPNAKVRAELPAAAPVEGTAGADGRFELRLEGGEVGQQVDLRALLSGTWSSWGINPLREADGAAVIVEGSSGGGGEQPAEPVVAEPAPEGADADFGIGGRGDGGEQPAEPVVADPAPEGADADFAIGDRGDGGEQAADAPITIGKISQQGNTAYVHFDGPEKSMLEFTSVFGTEYGAAGPGYLQTVALRSPADLKTTWTVRVQGRDDIAPVTFTTGEGTHAAEETTFEAKANPLFQDQIWLSIWSAPGSTWGSSVFVKGEDGQVLGKGTLLGSGHVQVTLYGLGAGEHTLTVLIDGVEHTTQVTV